MSCNKKFLSEQCSASNNLYYSVVQKICDENVFRQLKLLCLCETSEGGIVVIRNAVNGTPVLTSSFSKFFPQPFNFSNKFVAFVVNSLQAFALIHPEATSCAGVLCLEVIKTSSDFNNQSFLSVCNLIDEIYCNTVTNSDISTLNCSLLDVTGDTIKAMLHDNITCGLYCHSNYSHLASLISLSFIKSVSPTSKTSCRFNMIKHIAIPGYSPECSVVFSGLFIKLSNIGIKVPSKMKTNNLMVCLFSSSMNGDADDYLNSDIILNVKSNSYFQKSTISCWMACLEALVKNGIDLVACQKLMHPRLKKYLFNCGVIALDQLGSEVAQDICHLSGCVALHRPCIVINKENFGSVENVEIVDKYGTSYFFMKQDTAKIQTMFVCNWTPAAVDELVEICSKCQKVLQISVSEYTAMNKLRKDIKQLNCELMNKQRFCSYHFGLMPQPTNCLWMETLTNYGILKQKDTLTCRASRVLPVKNGCEMFQRSMKTKLLRQTSSKSWSELLNENFQKEDTSGICADNIHVVNKPVLKYNLIAFINAVNTALEIANFVSGTSYVVIQQ